MAKRSGSGRKRPASMSSSPSFQRLKRGLTQRLAGAVKILTTQAGLPWTPDGFRASWGKAALKAGIRGLTVHDLRGTAAPRQALAGCTVPEIATITGHSVRDVQSILDANYLHRDVDLAESAVRKLEARFRKTRARGRNLIVPPQNRNGDCSVERS